MEADRNSELERGRPQPPTPLLLYVCKLRDCAEKYMVDLGGDT
jgi:hypothetical protein